MTVIAYFGIDAYPFFVSDMLLSREPRPGDVNTIRLPTVGNLQNFELFARESLPYVATRMVRKPYRIHVDKAFVAWAGPVAAGKSLYKALHQLLADDVPVEDAIDTAMLQLSDEHRAETSLIVVYASSATDATQGFRVAQRNCLTLESVRFGRCFFGGSGSEVLRTWIKEREPWLMNTSDPDDLAALPDAICQKLVFEESLVGAGGRSPFNTLLVDGCGGFYESMRLRYPGLEVIPRDICHLHVRVDDKGSAITRLMLYYTRILEGGSLCRVACVTSLHLQPHQLEGLELSHLLLSYDEIDMVVCPPFWGDETPQGHIHGTVPADNEDWAVASRHMCIETVALTMFTEEITIPREAIGHLSDESQFAAVDEQGTRNQSVIATNAQYSPAIELVQQEGQAMVRLDMTWLSPLLVRYRNSETQEHLVVADQGSFKVLG